MGRRKKTSTISLAEIRRQQRKRTARKRSNLTYITDTWKCPKCGSYRHIGLYVVDYEQHIDSWEATDILLCMNCGTVYKVRYQVFKNIEDIHCTAILEKRVIGRLDPSEFA
ncbi:MAG: hypothetical protein DRJ40_10995 [Thermoprotei archaeon]|nr:MAG: hypothetical protein DRJ40_10995 [Thermoprotei archaeon]